MIIILEGVDGVGKTTLAELLANIHNAEVVHATRETPNDWDYFFGILDSSYGRNIIADRSFWGQFAYQKKEERKLTREELHMLEGAVMRSGGVIIYVTANKEDIEARLASRGEVTSRPIKKLLKKYERLVSEAACKVITYNTSTGEVSINDHSIQR